MIAPVKMNSLLKASLGCLGTVAFLASCDPAGSDEREVQQLKKDNARIVAQIGEMQKAVDHVDTLRKQASVLTDKLREMSEEIASASPRERNEVYGEPLVRTVKNFPVTDDLEKNGIALEKIGRAYADRREELHAAEEAKKERRDDLQDRRAKFLGNEEFQQLKKPATL